ncbi:hypothetical protein ACFQJC_01365 [Haloferax namakaokahaiae]|uniref:FtsX-like permease family protein n=1 Tax=Haloferax namakaokahaiae TaxID=1748331 RepID=A0ABD5ZAU8_9EURY
MNGDKPYEDPIAAAILGDSPYERLRVGRYALFKQPLSRKLVWQSMIFSTLALVVPLTMTLPTSTQQLFSSDDLLLATPKILLLGAFGVGVVSVSALALTYVGYRRVTAPDGLTEREACKLLDIEDAASVVSLVTGALAVGIVVGIFLLGLGGDAAMSMFLSLGGENPFAPTAMPVSVLGVGLATSTLAVVFYALSRLFDRRLSA